MAPLVPAARLGAKGAFAPAACRRCPLDLGVGLLAEGSLGATQLAAVAPTDSGRESTAIDSDAVGAQRYETSGALCGLGMARWGQWTGFRGVSCVETECDEGRSRI